MVLASTDFETIFHQTHTDRGPHTTRTVSGRTYVLVGTYEEGEELDGFRMLFTDDRWDIRFESLIVDENGNLVPCPQGKVAVYRWAGETGYPEVSESRFRYLLRAAIDRHNAMEKQNAYIDCCRDAFDSLTRLE